jgi:hypothetical protein
MATSPAAAFALARNTASIRRRRTLTVVGAAGGAAGVWLVARAADIEPTVTMAGQPPMAIGLPVVVVTALAASLAAWVSLAALERLTRRGRALWTALALATLVISFGPILAAQAGTATRATLATMHLVVAAVLIPGLRGASHHSEGSMS